MTCLANAQTVVLNFEDLNPEPAAFDTMPVEYNGFSFAGWYYGPDEFYTPASGSIDLFSDYLNGDPDDYTQSWSGAITRSKPFVFEGAWFSGYSGVMIGMLADGKTRFSHWLPDAVGDIPYGPTFLASGYSGLVDRVWVYGVQGYYAMDDFTYSEAAPVPEPASGALLLAGLIAYAAKRRYSANRNPADATHSILL